MFYLPEYLAESSAAYLMWSSLLQDLLRIVGRKVLTSHIAFLLTETVLIHVVLFSRRRRTEQLQNTRPFFEVVYLKRLSDLPVALSV